MAFIYQPQQNHLFLALPPQAQERVFPYLELAPLAAGQVLMEAGAPPHFVYFPTDSIISLLCITENGSSSEIAMVGNEGMAGVGLFMGGDSMPIRAVVQSAGHAYRLNGAVLRQEFARSGAMQRLLLRYAQSLLTQTAQTAVCNRHHSVNQQVCRRLLMSLDRLPSNRLTMTQELMANMLGVRREGVNEAAGRLHAIGVIEYHRGHITVLDRPTLEQRCCECYTVVKREFERLLQDVRANRNNIDTRADGIDVPSWARYSHTKRSEVLCGHGLSVAR